MPSLQHQLLARVIGRLRKPHPVDDLPDLRRRLTEENRRVDGGPPRGVRRGHALRTINTPGFPVHTLWAEGDGRHDEDPRPPDRTLFWVHGGAYVHGTSPWQWRFGARLADALGARLVLPEYPLAPEFSVEDSFDALVRLLQETLADSPGGVVLGGDSAGGGYALALALALRDAGGPQPERLVLLAPWVDLTEAPGTAEAAADDPWLSYPHLAVYAAMWAGGEEQERLADPRVSPGLGDLHDLPPALVLCGTRDLLKPGCDALFTAADEADWELEYVVAPGLIHVYPLLPVPEADTAFDHIRAFCTPARVDVG